jgi:hypothetical protein
MVSYFMLRRRTNSDIFLIGSKKGSDRSGYQAERHVNGLVIFYLPGEKPIIVISYRA